MVSNVLTHKELCFVPLLYSVRTVMRDAVQFTTCTNPAPHPLGPQNAVHVPSTIYKPHSTALPDLPNFFHLSAHITYDELWLQSKPVTHLGLRFCSSVSRLTSNHQVIIGNVEIGKGVFVTIKKVGKNQLNSALSQTGHTHTFLP